LFEEELRDKFESGGNSGQWKRIFLATEGKPFKRGNKPPRREGRNFKSNLGMEFIKN